METKEKKFEINSLDIETINELEQIELRGGRAVASQLSSDGDAGALCNVDQCNCQTCKP